MLRNYQNMMENMILSLGMILIMGILAKNTASASRVTTDPEVFAQRNTRGILKCEFNSKKTVSTVTWSKGPIFKGSEEVVRFFLGFKTGPKYNDGYDLAPDNTTLIIENVKEEDAGTWWCNVVVLDPWTDKSSTNLTVIVPPNPPTISQCPSGQPCEVEVDKNDTNYTVTCTASGRRPPVNLIIYQDNERLNVDPQQRTNPDNPSTYDTILEIPVNLDSDKDEFVITCEAVGHHTLAEGDQRAQRVLTIQRNRHDPTMSKRQEDENPEGMGTVKIGIYAGVGAVVAIALIISIVIAIFIVSSKMKDSEKHDYENLPKGFRNGLCAKSPVYQSPVSAC